MGPSVEEGMTRVARPSGPTAAEPIDPFVTKNVTRPVGDPGLDECPTVAVSVRNPFTATGFGLG